MIGGRDYDGLCNPLKGNEYSWYILPIGWLHTTDPTLHVRTSNIQFQNQGCRFVPKKHVRKQTKPQICTLDLNMSEFPPGFGGVPWFRGQIYNPFGNQPSYSQHRWLGCPITETKRIVSRFHAPLKIPTHHLARPPTSASNSRTRTSRWNLPAMVIWSLGGTVGKPESQTDRRVVTLPRDENLGNYKGDVTLS